MKYLKVGNKAEWTAEAKRLEALLNLPEIKIWWKHKDYLKLIKQFSIACEMMESAK